MNARDLLLTGIRNTFRSRLRTSLTVVAIFIGAFTLTLTSAVGTGVSNYVSTQIDSLGSSDTLVVTKAATATEATGSGPRRYVASDDGTETGALPGSRVASSGALTSADVTKIGGIDGITGVTANVTISPSWISYADHGKWVLTMNLVRADRVDLAAGSGLSNSSSERQILLPTTYLHNLGLGSAADAVGRSVTIGIRDYAGEMHRVTGTVVGIQNATLFSSGASVNDALRSALTDAAATGRPAAVTTTYGSAIATYAHGTSATELDAIKSRLKDAGYTGQTVADELGTISTVTNGIVGVLDAFAVIALIAAGFGIVNTLLMSVQERTREIGLMKAMGMGSGRVFALFSTEAVFIGFLGSAIGAVVAIGLGTLLSDRLAATLLSGLPGLHLLSFSPAAVIAIVLVVMAISFLAGTLPARRAARQNPIDALRYE